LDRYNMLIRSLA